MDNYVEDYIEPIWNTYTSNSFEDEEFWNVPWKACFWCGNPEPTKSQNTCSTSTHISVKTLSFAMFASTYWRNWFIIHFVMTKGKKESNHIMIWLQWQFPALQSYLTPLIVGASAFDLVALLTCEVSTLMFNFRNLHILNLTDILLWSVHKIYIQTW